MEYELTQIELEPSFTNEDQEYLEQVELQCRLSELEVASEDQEYQSELEIALEYVQSVLDEMEDEQWSTGQISVFLDDFYADEEASNSPWVNVRDAWGQNFERAFREPDVVWLDEDVLASAEEDPLEILPQMDPLSLSSEATESVQKEKSDPSPPKPDPVFDSVNEHFFCFYSKVKYTEKVREQMCGEKKHSSV